MPLPLLPHKYRGVVFTDSGPILVTDGGDEIKGSRLYKCLLVLFETEPKNLRQLYGYLGMGKDQTVLEPGCRCYSQAANNGFYYGTVATVDNAFGKKAGQV